MDPAFVEQALGVVAHVEIVGPLRIAEALGLGRPCDVALAAAMKLGFVALAAPGAVTPASVIS